MEKIQKEFRMQNLEFRIRGKKFSIFFFVFLISISYILYSPILAYAASLYFSPSSDSYTVGGVFPVGIYVSSADQAMNAADGVVTFPTDKLEVVSLSKSGSIFSLWVMEPSFSNEAGTMNFEGVVLNPGFTGASGRIITVNFRAKAMGTASLDFSSGSVLANDGLGTNILARLGSAQFTLGVAVTTPVGKPSVSAPIVPAAPKIFSATHPEPDKWYSNNSPEFSWNLPADVTALKFSINDNPNAEPTTLQSPPISEKKIEALKDGVWYFHLSFKNAAGWGAVGHRKVMIDTEPPEPFEIKVDNDGDLTNPQPILYFKANDKTSGISHYEIKIGTGDIFPLLLGKIEKNSYKMPYQSFGKHPILVNAVDKAGNATPAGSEVTIEPLEPPKITDYPERIQIGDVLILKGTSAYPDSEVLIFVKGENGVVEKGTVSVDENGRWSYRHSGVLVKGIYQIWAEVRDKRGALSPPSASVTVSVGLPLLLKFGKIAIDYFTAMITLIVLLAILLLILLYIWHRVYVKRMKIKKEVKDAHESVRKAFHALREETEEDISKIDKKPGLSQEEKKARDEIKEALNISEEHIKREIDDIDKELE